MPEKFNNLPEIKDQVVTCEEFNVTHGFSKESLHMTKTLFEGAGALVRKDLYLSHTLKYKDAVFVVASNELPASENSMDVKKFDREIWEPISTRTDFTYFTYQYKD